MQNNGINNGTAFKLICNFFLFLGGLLCEEKRKKNEKSSVSDSMTFGFSFCIQPLDSCKFPAACPFVVSLLGNA